MMQMPSRILAVTMTLLIGGCADGDLGDVQAFVAEVKEKHLGAVDPLPEIEPYRSFTYDGSDLKDPFSRPKIDPVSGPSSTKPNADRRKEPLEYFALSDLRMVGVLKKENIVWGLIQDTGGTIHSVKIGNYAGQNDGKIVSIEETKINMVETVSDGRGAWVDNTASLTLGDQ